jgi:hypothetical protein
VRTQDAYSQFRCANSRLPSLPAGKCDVVVEVRRLCSATRQEAGMTEEPKTEKTRFELVLVSSHRPLLKDWLTTARKALGG